MHPNAQTLQRFYTAFNQLDHATMAACYAPDATFEDEAFSLKGREQIGGMWRMLCSAAQKPAAAKHWKLEYSGIEADANGGRNRDTILGDAFEAFLGALLLDKGEAAVEKFLYQVMIPQLEVGNFERVTDYKTSLQETLQVNGEIDITYLVIDEVGPAHDKTFTVQVMADQKVIGQGKGRSKKLAEQAAAKNALEAKG